MHLHHVCPRLYIPLSDITRRSSVLALSALGSDFRFSDLLSSSGKY
jgi:hypothetical protein